MENMNIVTLQATAKWLQLKEEEVEALLIKRPHIVFQWEARTGPTIKQEELETLLLFEGRPMPFGTPLLTPAQVGEVLRYSEDTVKEFIWRLHELRAVKVPLPVKVQVKCLRIPRFVVEELLGLGAEEPFPRIFTTEEAAERYGCEVVYIRDTIIHGRIPAFRVFPRVNSGWRIYAEDFSSILTKKQKDRLLLLICSSEGIGPDFSLLRLLLFDMLHIVSISAIMSRSSLMERLEKYKEEYCNSPTRLSAYLSAKDLVLQAFTRLEEEEEEAQVDTQEQVAQFLVFLLRAKRRIDGAYLLEKGVLFEALRLAVLYPFTRRRFINRLETYRKYCTTSAKLDAYAKAEALVQQVLNRLDE